MVLLTPGGQNMCLQFGARAVLWKVIFVQITAGFVETRSHPKKSRFLPDSSIFSGGNGLSFSFAHCLETKHKKQNQLLCPFGPCSLVLYRHTQKKAEN